MTSSRTHKPTNFAFSLMIAAATIFSLSSAVPVYAQDPTQANDTSQKPIILALEGIPVAPPKKPVPAKPDATEDETPKTTTVKQTQTETKGVGAGAGEAGPGAKTGRGVSVGVMALLGVSVIGIVAVAMGGGGGGGGGGGSTPTH